MSASVIVIAMDRKSFIVNAVVSVIKSKMLIEKNIEIIVVKNFNDADIDEKLTSFGVKNIFSKNMGLGHKIIESLQFSNAEFILFLEDDDLFIDTKLRRFFDILNRFPDISMYHNSYENMNSSENPSLQRKALNPKHDILIEQSDIKNVENIDLAMRKGATHNLSSMAVRRDILLSFSEILKQITFSLDHVLFLISIESDKPIFIDHSITTKINVHQSTSNPPLDSEYIKARKAFLLRAKWELELLSSYLRTPLSKRACSKMLLDIEILLNILLPGVKGRYMNRFCLYLQHSIKEKSIITIALVTLIPFSIFLKIFHIELYLLLAKLSR